MIEALLEILKMFNGYGLGALAFGVMLLMYFYNNNKFLSIQSDQFEKISKSFTDSISDIVSRIDKIANGIGKTKLNNVQRVTVFRAIMHEHIDRKIEYAKELLEKNHIKERPAQIKTCLKNEFFRITMEESEKLSSFDTEVGDMGKILMSIDFDSFMDDVYFIFFSDGTNEMKEKDLRSMMEGYVNNLVISVEKGI